MNKEFKIVKGNYTKEDDVVIQVDTSETVTNTTSSSFNVGNIKKEIDNINIKIESLNIEKQKFEELLDSVKTIIEDAVSVNI